MTLEHATKELLAISSELKKLSELGSIAGYDMVATAARGAATRRGELSSYVGNLSRQLLLSEKTQELVTFLSEKDQFAKLPDELKGEVHAYQRRIMFSKGVDSSLLDELTTLCTESEQLWIQVRDNGPYEKLSEQIQRLVSLNKEISQARIEYHHLEKPEHPLDPIIDQTDEGMTVSRLTGLFNQVRECTVPLLQAIKDQPDLPNLTEGKVALPTDAQYNLIKDFMNDVGYDSQYGVMGTGMHPCTYMVNRYDVRFTNHYYEDNMLTAFNSAMHEGGHGMYTMYVSPDLSNRITDGGISGSIQESSSRFWEICVAHSLPFWEYALTYIKKNTDDCLRGLSPQDLYTSLNRVNINPLRLRSDELSYNLHILIRFEIEKRLFDGSLKACEIEDAWNELSYKLLGITPDSPANGWLQDMHWPSNLFGYFQSYSVGNMNSAQIEHTIRKALPDFDTYLRTGCFTPIREWLIQNWYQYGRIYTPDETIRRLTGETTNAKYLCEHLTQKYRELYQL